MNAILALLVVLLEIVNLSKSRPSALISTSTELFGRNYTDIKYSTSGRRTTRSERGKSRILTNSRHGAEEQGIVFPDSSEVQERVDRIDRKPKCAGSLTFCENIEAYPRIKVNEVLRRNEAYADFFQSDEDDGISERFGPVEDVEKFMCPAHVRVVYPKAGETKSKKWKWIINESGTANGYVQGVKVETCMRQNGPCDLVGSLPDGYITSCKQKYVYRRMLSISENGDPVPDTFLMPSACCCSYKRDQQFLSRFGKAETRLP